MDLLKILFVDTSDLNINNLMSSSLLNDEDKEKINSFSHEVSKKEKTVSSYLIKKYVGDYQINQFGKPISKDIHFNISHSKGFVVFVMDNYPIGIDIELIRDYKKELKEFVTSKEEKEYIKTNINFFEIWTNKESLLKCVGTGIGCHMDVIPGLPINSLKEWNNKLFRSKTIVYRDCVITITRESKKDFNVAIVEEMDEENE